MNFIFNKQVQTNFLFFYLQTVHASILFYCVNEISKINLLLRRFLILLLVFASQLTIQLAISQVETKLFCE